MDLTRKTMSGKIPARRTADTAENNRRKTRRPVSQATTGGQENTPLNLESPSALPNHRLAGNHESHPLQLTLPLHSRAQSSHKPNLFHPSW